MAVLLAIVSAGVFLLPSQEGRVRIDVPMVLENSQLPTDADNVASAEPLSVTVSPSVVAFGDVRAGGQSEPVELKVRNLGAAPVRVHVDPGAFMDAASGVAWPEDAVRVFASEPGEAAPASDADAAPVVAAGETLSVWIQLHVPSGAETYVPAGDYAGTLSLELEEVDA